MNDVFVIDKNDKIELNMFDAVLAQFSLELKSEFQHATKNIIGANVIIDNFKTTETLADYINQMVKTQTKDKIEKLVETKLDPQLMIFNVVNFPYKFIYIDNASFPVFKPILINLRAIFAYEKNFTFYKYNFNSFAIIF